MVCKRKSVYWCGYESAGCERLCVKQDEEAILSAAVSAWRTEGTKTKFCCSGCRASLFRSFVLWLLHMYTVLWLPLAQFCNQLTQTHVIRHFVLLLYLYGRQGVNPIGRQYKLFMHGEWYYCLAELLKNVALNIHEKGQLLLNLYSSPVASKIEQFMINNNLVRKYTLCILLHQHTEYCYSWLVDYIPNIP